MPVAATPPDRHTSLAALAQLRQAVIRNHLCGHITLPDAPAGSSHHDSLDGEDDVSGADLRIPLGDAPVPARGGQLLLSRAATPGRIPSHAEARRKPPYRGFFITTS